LNACFSVFFKNIKVAVKPLTDFMKVDFPALLIKIIFHFSDKCMQG